MGETKQELVRWVERTIRSVHHSLLISPIFVQKVEASTAGSSLFKSYARRVSSDDSDD